MAARSAGMILTYGYALKEYLCNIICIGLLLLTVALFMTFIDGNKIRRMVNEK